MTKTAQASSTRSRARWWVGIGIALIGLVFIFRSQFQLTIVVGSSMFPTLSTGDLLLVDKQAYAKAEPHRGDIVVARNTSGLIVKRIVGLPGEEVEVRMGMLYINGKPMRENHPVEEGFLYVGKGKLLEGDFATLGDNRAVSALTAVHPILRKAEILGKVIFAPGRKLL